MFYSELVSRHKSIAVFLCLVGNLGPSQLAHAQFAQLLKGGVRIEIASDQNSQTNADTKKISVADLVGYKKESPDAIPTEPLYSSSQQLFEAARRGELSGIDRASNDEKAQLINAVLYIFIAEFKVPPVNKQCYVISHGFPSDVMDLLTQITQVTMKTLSNEGPEFTVPHQEWLVNSIDKKLKALQRPTDTTAPCDIKTMGRVAPHPYKAALISLAGGYAKATQAYVDAERERRKRDFQDDVAKKQGQARQRQEAVDAEIARQKAEKQQSIDAETARIKAEEQRRAAKERARVGG